MVVVFGGRPNVSDSCTNAARPRYHTAHKDGLVEVEATVVRTSREAAARAAVQQRAVDEMDRKFLPIASLSLIGDATSPESLMAKEASEVC